MKIAWMHSHFQNWMGGHKYVFEIVRQLKKNHQVEVFASTASDYSRNQFKSQDVKLTTVNFTSTYNPLYWLILPVMIALESAKLKNLTKDADVIITSYFPSHLWAEKIGRPYFQICYEPLAFFYDNDLISSYPLLIRYFLNVMKKLYAGADKKALLKAEKCFTLSVFNKKWTETVYGRDDIKVLYEGVDADFFRPKYDKKLSERYRNKKIIFHTTDFTKTKGTDILINSLPPVIEKFPETVLLISSTIKNSIEKNKLLKKAGKLGIFGNVIFLGYVDHRLLPAYYSIAKVVVQPSRFQSMSLAVKEAMACQTPVITSLEGKEQFSSGSAGYLVDVNNISDLTENILRILSAENSAKSMGEKGRQIVKEKFSWDAVSNKILSNL